MSFDSTPRIRRSPVHKIVLAMVLVVAAMPFWSAHAAYRTWSKGSGDVRITLEAELLNFDFESKEVVCRDRQGAEHRLATRNLDTGSRMQLLLSPEFLRSFPEDEISKEQRYYILLAIAVPSLFLLVSFFLSAIILTKSFNPIRAVIGWGGSVVLGAFLISFYVVLSARSPGAATGIAVFGSIVVSGLLSLYVSIVYRTTLWKGFKLLVLHVISAVFMLALLVLVLKFTIAPDRTADFLENNVFKPTGVIAL